MIPIGCHLISHLTPDFRYNEQYRLTRPFVIPVASNAVAPVTSMAPPSSPLPLHLTPVLGSLIGIGSALVLTAAIIVLIMRLRQNEHRRRRGAPSTGFDKASVPLHADADDSFDLQKQKKSRISQEGEISTLRIVSRPLIILLAVDDTRDEEEKAFDKILSMSSTSKRILIVPQKAGTLKVNETFNFEPSLQPVLCFTRPAST
jgi:hypothetical protein